MCTLQVAPFYRCCFSSTGLKYPAVILLEKPKSSSPFTTKRESPSECQTGRTRGTVRWRIGQSSSTTSSVTWCLIAESDRTRRSVRTPAQSATTVTFMLTAHATRWPSRSGVYVLFRYPTPPPPPLSPVPSRPAKSEHSHAPVSDHARSHSSTLPSLLPPLPPGSCNTHSCLNRFSLLFSATSS